MVTSKYTLALPQSTPYASLQAGCIRVPRATPPQTPPMHNPHKHLLNQYTLSPCKASHLIKNMLTFCKPMQQALIERSYLPSNKKQRP